jgi:hypothetical protein
VLVLGSDPSAILVVKINGKERKELSSAAVKECGVSCVVVSEYSSTGTLIDWLNNWLLIGQLGTGCGLWLAPTQIGWNGDSLGYSSLIF